MQGNVSGSWRFWDKAIYAIYEIFYGLFKMALKNEESKSKSFVTRIFGSKEKEKNTMRVTKYNSEEDADSVSGLDPATEISQSIKTLRIYVATWNVGGNPPSSDLNLDEFLQVHDQPDIYVLGFQEIVPLNAGNVLVLEDNEPAAKWLYLINQSLNSLPTTNSSPIKAASLEAKASLSMKGSKLVSTSTGPNFFQKYSLKAVSKQFRTESKKRLKTCNCVPELERRYYSNKDSCFRCQQSNGSEDDLSSGDDDGSSGFDTPEVVAPSSNSSDHHVKYGLVASKQMVGIFLTIWVKKELVQHVSHMRTSYIPRGIMGCLGNKGCISVSLSIYQTSFCFICSHLASGEKEGDELRRNSDVIEILKNTQFRRICRVPNSRVPERILEHEITLSYAETRTLLDENDWDSLLSNDQLKIEREAGRVFNGWKEGEISFAPTYKYSFNSDTYFAETNTSKHKKRTPAWCDRILWHGNGMSQVWYIRKDSKEFQFSDHRPVCAMFWVDVLTLDVSRRGSSNTNVKVEIEELLAIPDRE